MYSGIRSFFYFGRQRSFVQSGIRGNLRNRWKAKNIKFASLWIHLHGRSWKNNYSSGMLFASTCDHSNNICFEILYSGIKPQSGSRAQRHIRLFWQTGIFGYSGKLLYSGIRGERHIRVFGQTNIFRLSGGRSIRVIGTHLYSDSRANIRIRESDKASMELDTAVNMFASEVNAATSQRRCLKTKISQPFF